MPDRCSLPGLLAALGLALAGDVAAQPACPPTSASLGVFVENLSAEPSVMVDVAGELLDPLATCTGTGDASYTASFTCDGAGVAACGTVSGLRPGAWVSHLGVTVAGTSRQLQHRRDVVVAGGSASNVVVWTVYPRTEVVADVTEQALRDALAAASPGPALVTFSPAKFPGADVPQTILLGPGVCPVGHQAAICLADSGIVLDGLDARGRAGAVHLSVGAADLSVIHVFGSDDVLRGLVLDGTQLSGLANQRDTIAFTGPLAVRNHLDDSIVNGPSRGDAVSGDGRAGLSDDDANVVDGCELAGAQDKGLKVTTGAHVTIRRSCVHDNRNGGLQATLGGHVMAVENLIQHNAPGASQNGIAVRGLSPCFSDHAYPDCDEPSTATTDGNVVRYHGGRGLTATDNAVAFFADDYVADNQIIGSKVETTTHALASGESPGHFPVAGFRGVALVCNRNAGISGTCQPQSGSEGTACGVDEDCCGLPDGCCVTDPGCVAPLRCQPLSGVQGFGASQAQAAGEPAPQVDYGTADEPGGNAFAWNVGTVAGGVNFNVNVTNLAVSAEGNQWEHCGAGASCDLGAVRSSDVRLATGATVALGAPPGARAGAPVLGSVSPGRPHRGELVRVFGDRFDAIDGAACAHEVAPADPCSGENLPVEAQSQLTGVNAVTILSGNTVLASVWPDAVTPTMLAFRMPFDCFAPLTLRVAKPDPTATVLTGTIPLCDPGGCVGKPAGHPCNDGDACTSGDHCDGDGACIPGGPTVCAGGCLTGACDPASGCVPRPAGTPCDDGDACTAGDHCSGQGDTCLGGGPRECRGVCLTGACDPASGCVPKPAGDPCDDGDPCTSADHCAGDRDVCVPGSVACDDGDPCTAGDVCSGGVCRGTAVRGFDGAICRVHQRPLAPLCTADGGNVALDRVASNRLRKAETLLQRAANTSRISLRNQLVRHSAGVVGDVSALAARYRRDGKIPRECAAAAKQAVGALRRLILALLV